MEGLLNPLRKPSKSYCKGITAAVQTPYVSALWHLAAKGAQKGAPGSGRFARTLRRCGPSPSTLHLVDGAGRTRVYPPLGVKGLPQR